MRRFWVVTLVALAVSAVVDLLLGVDAPGLIGAYSFVGCAVIILASKWLGKRYLQRPESYYGPPEFLAEDRLSGAAPPPSHDRRGGGTGA